MGGIHDVRDPGQTLVVVEIEGSRRRHGGKEPTGDRAVPVRVVQGDVHVRRHRPARPDLDDALDPGDAYLVDVHRRDDRRAGNGVVVDPRRAALVIRGQLGHDAEGEAMDVPDLIEVVALGQGGSGYDAALGVARDGAQVLDVGGEEQPAVVDPKRVGRVRKEAELHSRAHLMLVAGKRGVVVVEPYAGPQLPFVRGREGGLRVYAAVI